MKSLGNGTQRQPTGGVSISGFATLTGSQSRSLSAKVSPFRTTAGTRTPPRLTIIKSPQVLRNVPVRIGLACLLPLLVVRDVLERQEGGVDDFTLLSEFLPTRFLLPVEPL